MDLQGEEEKCWVEERRDISGGACVANMIIMIERFSLRLLKPVSENEC